MAPSVDDPTSGRLRAVSFVRNAACQCVWMMDAQFVYRGAGKNYVGFIAEASSASGGRVVGGYGVWPNTQ